MLLSRGRSRVGSVCTNEATHSTRLRPVHRGYRVEVTVDPLIADEIVSTAGEREALEGLHIIQEPARHAGHADILREQIDGATGD